MEGINDMDQFENRRQQFAQLKELLTVTKPEDSKLAEAEYDF